MFKHLLSQRLRCEFQDLIELIVIPALAAILPWKIAFRVFRWLCVHCSWLYKAECERALKLAKLYEAVNDEAHWLFERRLVTLVDHADLFLSLTRSDRWCRRFVDVSGKWPQNHKKGLLITFHWGCGLWAHRHAHSAGLKPHMLVAPIKGLFADRWVRHAYVSLRMFAVSRADGRDVVYVPGVMNIVRNILKADEQILVVLDVPADQVNYIETVVLLGRTIKVPRALIRMAVKENVLITVFTLDLCLETGRRGLVIEQVALEQDIASTVQSVFARWETILRKRPASWHLWGEADRFFNSSV